MYKALAGTALGCPAHPGSVKTLQVARAADIVSVPSCLSSTDGTLEDLITPVDPSLWKTYTFQRNEVRYEERPQDTAAGTYYNATISGLNPGSKALLRYEQAALQDGEYILKVELYTGPTLLVGNLESPMRFRGGFTSGRRRTDSNQTEWEFYGQLRVPACQLVPALSRCDALSMADFALEPWLLDTGEELLGIYVALATLTSIATINSRPDGTVVGPAGTPVDTVQWNAGLGYYVPVNGPNYLDDVGNYTVTIPSISVTLKTGESCSITFTQVHTYNPGNVVPQSQAPTISSNAGGLVFEGTTLSFSATYFDLDDAQDTGQTVRKIYRCDDVAKSNPVEVASGDGSAPLTYIVPSGVGGKYYYGTETPAALTGPSPGDEVESGVIGPVLTSIIQATSTRNGTFSLVIIVSAGQVLGIDWGDGSPLSQVILPSGGTTVTHTYTSSASKTISIASSAPGGVTLVNLAAQNLTGTLALSNLSALTQINHGSNTGLQNVTFTSCGGTLTSYIGNACGINQALNFAAFTFDGILNLDDNESMPPPVNLVGQFSQIVLDGNLGNLDLSAVTLKNAGVIAIRDGNLTGFVAPAYAGTLASINLQFNAALTGVDFGGPAFSNSIIYLSFTGVTALDFSGASGTIAELVVRSSAFKNVPASISAVSLTANGQIYLDNNAMTQAQVDAWAAAIEDMYPASPASLAGAIVNMAGTNAAPSPTGDTIFDALAARNATVTTS